MKHSKAERDFVNFYIDQNFRDGTAAYCRAHPRASNETARRAASRLLATPRIQSLLSDTLSDILGREKIPLEKKLFDYWVKRAFYRITDIIDLDGNMLMTRDQLEEKGLDVCIDSINEKTDAQGHSIVTYKFADRDEAADMLQKYINMIKPPIQKFEFLTPESERRLQAIFDGTPQEKK
ncbi:hypothetical protein AGMMS49587_16620 [Spirochaetia bacterium]|nr:hypothetical protein AGMMS49587_16620 [Spirochaetia bacterium]